MEKGDWPAVATIYSQGISSGFATFETEVPSFEEWDTAHLQSCRLVATAAAEILGWAAISPVSGRCVYGGVAELSVYVGNNARKQGVGQALMEALIQESEASGIWSLQAGIFPQNIASIALHKKMGFRYIGKRERIGQREGIWYDNLLFERRSQSVGI